MMNVFIDSKISNPAGVQLLANKRFEAIQDDRLGAEEKSLLKKLQKNN